MFSCQIDIMGKDYIEFLKKNDNLDSLIIMLKNHENESKDLQKIPTKVIEFKLGHVRAAAI